MAASVFKCEAVKAFGLRHGLHLLGVAGHDETGRRSQTLFCNGDPVLTVRAAGGGRYEVTADPFEQCGLHFDPLSHTARKKNSFDADKVQMFAMCALRSWRCEQALEAEEGVAQ